MTTFSLPAIAGTKMLAEVVVYWNVVYLVLCFLLNFSALIVQLGKWRKRYKGGDSNPEVASPAAVVVLFVICANLVQH